MGAEARVRARREKARNRGLGRWGPGGGTGYVMLERCRGYAWSGGAAIGRQRDKAGREGRKTWPGWG